MIDRVVLEQDREMLASIREHPLEIPDAYPVKLQVLDLARHVVVAPDGKRYVLATFDDRRLGRGFVTAVYPQQNGYLTLYRLVVYEHSSNTPQEALEYHKRLAKMIQQGQLMECVKQAKEEGRTEVKAGLVSR
ncbi:hypothetical protein [Thermogemmatispora carboxidivorans]|uniref:hypothetical protein n=1 Tax=Thermogemmatispora carboxidivorans TaxID=1382306 RepID=UPI00069C52A0|nr:hypothetical protein [Thermogemmatispora carboxidivorans]